MPGLTIDSVREGTVHILVLHGELDLGSIDELGEQLRLVEDGAAEEIVVDLRDLRFIDSSGLRALLLAHQRSARDGGRLRLRRGPEAVQRVFAITGTADDLPFVD